VPVVNCETSLQIEASENTFACKDTEKERVFRLELPASHTYHRYHHEVPSFLAGRAAHGKRLKIGSTASQVVRLIGLLLVFASQKIVHKARNEMAESIVPLRKFTSLSLTFSQVV